MKVLRSRWAVATLLTGAIPLLAACGSSSSKSGSSSSGGKGPITIGVSLSLSGDFAADGQAFQKGYQLWARDQNAKGGLLGRQVKLEILSDASSPAQVVSNYQKLIGSDHVPVVFGPFSSLLSGPAGTVANRYHYAFLEPAGGGPKVFALHLPNLFFVQPAARKSSRTGYQSAASTLLPCTNTTCTCFNG